MLHSLQQRRGRRPEFEPFVEAMLALRERARTARDFDTSDMIRDQLVAAELQVQDTESGPTWNLGA